ncbi:hypothetical protein HHL08_14255 [Sphingobium sp. AR-3-1]|uniref:Twin-arginine translocation signal domain-containing protein n=1 Tax=Sphingobium psychrophilum TaxID=2728834 RepID=A0A7X9WWQ8_9SPHN|nr:hypothetical protein [Sphingobium psychrophilum]NML11294.1 hypothetical protein [Sphingobium psychrophilum]
MASSANTSSRRAFLAAAALAPVAVAMPAMAAPQTSLADLIAEYWQIMAEYEQHPFHNTRGIEPNYESLRAQGDAIHDRAIAVQQRALRMPAKNGREVGMKLDMILKDYQDCQLPEELIEVIARDAMRLG